MTKKTKEKMIRLRKEGKTYQEIGDIFGLSRQRIHQVIAGYPPIAPQKKKGRFGLTGSEWKMYRIYKAKGWWMIHRGIPDFLLYRWDEKSQSYAWEWREVKRNRDFKLNEAQKKVFRIFKLLKFPVKIDYATDYNLKDYL